MIKDILIVLRDCILNMVLQVAPFSVELHSRNFICLFEVLGKVFDRFERNPLIFTCLFEILGVMFVFVILLTLFPDLHNLLLLAIPFKRVI